ncbi:MAG: dissimilatory-type sulfite reductase subunit beta [Nitrososphaerota archaeon]|nr:dissimilatory-type sulfite reductase subunit beta [Nitrososphaerota archaeon]
MKKRLPVPYTDFLPEEIRRNVGKWADRRFHGEGIIEHISNTGESVFTVKVGSPPNVRFSTQTLRKLSDIADKHGIGALRFTRAGNVELLAHSLEGALEMKRSVEGLGYYTGGWGNTLWSIGSCTAYLTCTTAVVDSPSLTKVLYDRLTPYFTGEASLPAKLRINVGGCPTGCGGLVADIVVIGHYGDAPSYDPEKIKRCLPMNADALDKAVPELVMVCPVNAIRAYKKPDNTVGIDIIRDKCIACGRCRDVCDHITWDQSKIGVSVLVGGKSSNTGDGPALARVLVPWVPARPPDFREVVAVVQKLIDVWKSDAGPGERLADYAHRVGLQALQETMRVPITRWNKPTAFGTGFGVRQFFPSFAGTPPRERGSR